MVLVDRDGSVERRESEKMFLVPNSGQNAGNPMPNVGSHEENYRATLPASLPKFTLPGQVRVNSICS